MNYKSYIGPPKLYDKIGHVVFEMMKEQGLRKTHNVLDIGCGSLRVGQHLINYLNKKRYYGIEPNTWLIEEALKNESIKIDKEPNFENNSDFVIPFDADFDMVIANSIFIHACPQQIEKCIDNVMLKLKEGGKFIFNFIPGKDSQASEWTYPGAVTYSRAFIEERLKDYNYKYIDVDYPGRQVFVVVEHKEA